MGQLRASELEVDVLRQEVSAHKLVLCVSSFWCCPYRSFSHHRFDPLTWIT